SLGESPATISRILSFLRFTLSLLRVYRFLEPSPRATQFLKYRRQLFLPDSCDLPATVTFAVEERQDLDTVRVHCSHRCADALHFVLVIQIAFRRRDFQSADIVANQFLTLARLKKVQRLMRRSLIQVARRIRAEIALNRRPLNQHRENVLRNIFGILLIAGYP